MEQSIEEKYPYAFHRQRPPHEGCDEFTVRHPKMQLGQRAKIFSPFAALRGFETAIDSKLERYVGRAELTEEDQERVNRVLREIAERRREHPTVTVTYFVPCGDENHEAYGLGGKVETLTGSVQNFDPVVRKAIRISETVIDLSDILEIRTEEDDVLPVLHGDVAGTAPDR